MKGFYTILLLIVSNVFMTFAWYGHLKMKQEYSWFAALPLIGVIAFSWAIAFFEYSCQIPANRIGFIGNGGPFSLMQLKVIQEVITLVIFTVFTTIFFKGEALHWLNKPLPVIALYMPAAAAVPIKNNVLFFTLFTSVIFVVYVTFRKISVCGGFFYCVF